MANLRCERKILNENIKMLESCFETLLKYFHEQGLGDIPSELIEMLTGYGLDTALLSTCHVDTPVKPDLWQN